MFYPVNSNVLPCQSFQSYQRENDLTHINRKGQRVSILCPLALLRLQAATPGKKGKDSEYGKL